MILTVLQKTNNSSADMSKIRELIERDPMKRLSDQEKQFLWSRRKLCLTLADSLPRLLESVTWASRDHVSQVVKSCNFYYSSEICVFVDSLPFKNCN